MIKIDNLYEVESLNIFNKYNVNIVSISDKAFMKKDFFEKVLMLKSSFNRTVEFCLELNEDFVETEEKIWRIISEVSPHWIQFDSSTLISLKAIKEIQERDIKIIYKTTHLDCDEDIYWKFPAFSKDHQLNEEGILNIFSKYNIFLQIDIMPTHDNGWHTLKNECGKFEDDITIEKLNKFMDKYNTFIGLNYTQKNFDEIKKDLNKAYGYILRIEDENKNFQENSLSMQNLVSILKI